MNNRTFYKDAHWYVALILGTLFWATLPLLYVEVDFSQREMSFRSLLFGVVLYPVFEEIMFRGWLQPFLFNKWRFCRIQHAGISGSNVLTSVLFAALHLINQSTLWSLSIFFPSLIFGYFRDRYQTLVPSILLHGLYNLGLILVFHYLDLTQN